MAKSATNAIGLLSHSVEFWRDAEVLLRADRNRSLGTFYLLSHSLELALKSALLGSGVASLNQLKSDFGHDLVRASNAIIESDNEELGKLVSAHLNWIKVLNSHYKSKDFEYWKRQVLSLPDPLEIGKFLQKLQDLVRPIALSAHLTDD